MLRLSLVFVVTCSVACSAEAPPLEPSRTAPRACEGGWSVEEDYWDEGFPTHETFFDAEGRKIRLEIDSDWDLRPDSIDVWDYDAEGRVVAMWRDSRANGQLVLERDYTYDAFGNRLMERYDRDRDGVWDEVTSWDYLYDDAGNPIREERFEVDDFLERKTRTYRTFDANGNWLTRAVDDGADGTVEGRNEATWDAEGRQLTFETDWYADGTINEIAAWEYDDGGRLVMETFDRYADGDLERVLTYTYDGFGRLALTTLDHDGDGEIDSVTEHTYNHQGWLLSELTDANFNGYPEHGRVYTHEIEYGHRVVTRVHTDDGHLLQTIRYDCD